MEPETTIRSRTFVAQSAKSGAFKTGRANEGARAQSEKARNHISRKKEQLQGAMRQGAGGGPALAQAHARRGGRRTWDDGEGDGGDHDDHDDHEDGEDDGGGGQRQRGVCVQTTHGRLLQGVTVVAVAASRSSKLACPPRPLWLAVAGRFVSCGLRASPLTTNTSPLRSDPGAA
ncbi:hypothetical protein J3E72DRAFT_264988 [Bipolaris maydis]|nr:hypothetical protein J3E72DRAFT_264988 [Bipolaris maydis]